MTATYILAAGKQSRFKSETPKGLMPWKNGKTVLDVNVENALKSSDKVIIVTSFDNYDIYNEYVKSHFDLYKVEVMSIKENHGSGSTIFQALEPNKYGHCFLMWADSVQEDPNIFKACITVFNNSYNCFMVVPCRYEQNPYTIIKFDSSMRATGCKFKKFGEIRKSAGCHDLSLFYFDAFQCFNVLNKLVMSNDLIEKHGNEVEFLDVINLTNKIRVFCYETDKVYSFNTIEEFNKLK